MFNSNLAAMIVDFIGLTFMCMDENGPKTKSQGMYQWKYQTNTINSNVTTNNIGDVERYVDWGDNAHYYSKIHLTSTERHTVSASYQYPVNKKRKFGTFKRNNQQNATTYRIICINPMKSIDSLPRRYGSYGSNNSIQTKGIHYIRNGAVTVHIDRGKTINMYSNYSDLKYIDGHPPRFLTNGNRHTNPAQGLFNNIQRPYIAYDICQWNNLSPLLFKGLFSGVYNTYWPVEILDKYATVCGIKTEEVYKCITICPHTNKKMVHESNIYSCHNAYLHYTP